MKMPSARRSHCLSGSADTGSGYMSVRSQSNDGIQESAPVNEEDIDNQKEIDIDCHSGEVLR